MIDTPGPFDLLLRGAHVIDPSQNHNGPADIGVRAGKIAAFGRDLDPTGSADVRDLSGTYLCPGLIDIHGHWYEGSMYGINADFGLNHGVTTAVDAGTTGFTNFPEFRRTAFAANRTRMLGFVHLSCLGLQTPFAEELLDLRYARPGETAEVVQRHTDVATGVKVRIGSMTADHGNRALDLAVEAARRAGTRLMVHISAGADEVYVLDHLRPGDILTHCFHGNANRLIASDGSGFIEQVHAARQRGVIFDVGHGCGSFSWETAQKAFEHHFWPDTISTDLHRYSVDSPWRVTMPSVMSKFLLLGMGLYHVVEKCTAAAACAIGRPHQVGSLQPGYPADAFAFTVREGEFRFTDAHRRERIGNRLIEPALILRDGQPIAPGSVPVTLRDLYEADRCVFGAVLPGGERS